MMLHTCNNKWCINPKHLYLGDHKENGIDRWNDASLAEINKFKALMRKITSDPLYKHKMHLATVGIPKSEAFKVKASVAAKNRPPISNRTRIKMSKSAKLRCARINREAMSERMRLVARARYV